jgi:hypothetical protein
MEASIVVNSDFWLENCCVESESKRSDNTTDANVGVAVGAGVESQCVHDFDAVGLRVGVVDGKGLGTLVGDFDGSRLGTSVGVEESVLAEMLAACTDGIAVGSAEVLKDGCSVVNDPGSEGRALGASEGAELGSREGVLLALAEGTKAWNQSSEEVCVSSLCEQESAKSNRTAKMRACVGCNVGVRDGTRVGVFVGVVVGDRLGFCRNRTFCVQFCSIKRSSTYKGSIHSRKCSSTKR